jgi:tetratricopeptide (TPR) repeat protein
MLNRVHIYQLRGRFQESLLILDSLLSRDPENLDAMEAKALALLKLGRPNEAAAPATAAYQRVLRKEDNGDRADSAALLAAIDYELADYAAAERLAQKAITEMSKARLSNSNAGTVRLTLIAAAAHLHDDTAKKAALSDLAISVPELTSLSAIRKWMYPQSNLYGYEPLFEGLRLAGLHD